MEHSSIFLLGRQAAIGMAELESLYGGDNLQWVNDCCASCRLKPSSISFNRLGGSIKLGAYLGTINSSRWADVKNELLNFILDCANDLSDGKLQIGLSIYGFNISPTLLVQTGLELKRAMRHHNYSIRLTPNKDHALSSAQVLYNHLTGDRGIELLIIQSGSQTILAKSVAVQDISAYARRDQTRPKRDTFIGMLPPKLAQIIVNLATGTIPATANSTILDPFCGTGVILQEALLTGFSAYGSDIEPRMIDFSRDNIKWLTTHHQGIAAPVIELGDATKHSWRHPLSAIASETYLGRPLSKWPTPEKLTVIINTCNVIIERFLLNIANQTTQDTRLCLAIPAWINPFNSEIKQLPLLDHLDNLGYNRVSFLHVTARDMIYYRPGQLVGRELLVLTRK